MLPREGTKSPGEAHGSGLVTRPLRWPTASTVYLGVFSPCLVLFLMQHLLAWLTLALPVQEGPRLPEGRWIASLEAPGCPLYFVLELEHSASGRERAFLCNGPQRLRIPEVAFDGEELRLDLPRQSSRIRARLVEYAAGVPKGFWGLDGIWETRRGDGTVTSLAFHAGSSLRPEWGAGPRFVPGRWRVDFGNEDPDAILVAAGLQGRLFTATGECRYFEIQPHRDVNLSSFDGAEGLLLRARSEEDGSLLGDLWSSTGTLRSLIATREDVPGLTEPRSSFRLPELADLRFPDVDGVQRSLGDFAGKTTLLFVHGSWSPESEAEAKLLAELSATYRERGLVILGLAFERTGELALDSEQAMNFARRHGLDCPIFLGGTADLDEATRALRLFADRIQAFPTTVFIDANGLPRAILSGLGGPDGEHANLRSEFITRIEELLGEP